MLKRVLQGRFIDHPLHPIAVHLPVGLWSAALVFDLLSVTAGLPALASASFYCILLGLVGVLIAFPTGLAEYAGTPDSTLPKRIARTHMILNGIVSLLFAINLYLRYRLEGGVPSEITVPQVVLTTVAIALLGVSGYLGGKLVYQYGIGLHPRRRDALEATEGERDRRIA